MTDILRAKESAIAAETEVEQLLFGALKQLNIYNKRLLDLHDEIKQSQPVRTGTVALELYPCGPKCTGCPHARWVMYKWTEPKGDQQPIMLGINLDAQKKDPILSLKRRTDNYKITAELIREAKTILAKRAALLASIRPLRHTGVKPSD